MHQVERGIGLNQSGCIGVKGAYDFFGLLGGMEIDDKKDSVLQTYKLIFRFSIEKLLNYLRDDSFLVILLQYIQ